MVVRPHFHLICRKHFEMILIKNGLFFSGDLNDKATRKNIVIDGKGKIGKITSAEISTSPDFRIIDATDKWVVPGFIDCHTHYDAEVIVSPGLKESARHGITTVILGSCSVSAVYNSPEDTSDCFARVEAVPREIILPILRKNKTWETAAEWKSYINGLPLGINVGSFIGHSDIRMKAMGISRSLKEGERATAKEKSVMDHMLNEALDAGFFGLSTMDSPWDKMDGNRYWSHKTPSFYASWKERKGLLAILRKRGAILQGTPNVVTRINAIHYMMASMGWFRKPLKTSMLAMMDLIGDRYILPLTSFTSRFTNVIGRGDFRMQSLPCPFTVYYDGIESVMFEEFPSGEALRHLAKALDQRNKLIRDKAFRERFKSEMRRKFAPKIWHKDLSRSIILSAPDKELIGQDFFGLAIRRKEHPVDTFLDLILQYDKNIQWTTTIANDRKEKYRHMYNFPYNLIGFSDAGAHLNNMAFYNFPLQMIQVVKESIERGNPIMRMEKCIWRLTKELADWFGMERGFLAEGRIADIAILDPKKFDSVSGDVYSDVIEDFNNYKRLVNRNCGAVSQVIVKGEIIFDMGKFVRDYGKKKKFGCFIEKSK